MFDMLKNCRRSTRNARSRPIRSARRTPQGAIIRYADRIAYINHDIDDALRAGILQKDELPAPIFGAAICA